MHNVLIKLLNRQQARQCWQRDSTFTCEHGTGLQRLDMVPSIHAIDWHLCREVADVILGRIHQEDIVGGQVPCIADKAGSNTWSELVEDCCQSGTMSHPQPPSLPRSLASKW